MGINNKIHLINLNEIFTDAFTCIYIAILGCEYKKNERQLEVQIFHNTRLWWCWQKLEYFQKLRFVRKIRDKSTEYSVVTYSVT